MTAAIASEAFPGGVVLAGDDRRIRFARGYGHVTWDGTGSRPSPRSSLFDLASLTKVVATTGVMARLVERGEVDLDAPVQRYLPRFTGTGKERVTVRMLLDHTSGLKPFVRFYQVAPTRDSALTLLYAEPLSRPPDSSAVYSDLNAMLLGLVIERVTGRSLEAAVRREVLAPLHLAETRFRPPVRSWRRAVPTGRDAGEPVMGIVNDRNCDFFGGVTGHAGLFSTGTDLARVAMAWLRAARGLDSSWIHPATARRFLAARPTAGTRRLGWDSRDWSLQEPGSFGTRTSAQAFGHTGWTGTQVWVDPEANRWGVLLTNRSFSPRRTDTFDAMRRARAAVTDAVLASLSRTGG